MLFRADDAMKNYISGVILYDETLRQKAADGTPLVDLIKRGRRCARHQGRRRRQAARRLPGETITEGLDGLRERLKEYYRLGARFAKWRAVISISDGLPTWGAVKQNAQALARYAALCQEAGIVPIVEPEVLMDGEPGTHSIDRCYDVTEWVLKTVFDELYDARVSLEGMVLKPNMVIDGKNGAQGVARGSRRKDAARAEGDRAAGRARHRLPVRRPVGRGGDGASVDHERGRPAALEADLLLWPRAAGGRAQGMGRQGGERRRRPARLRPPRPDEQPRCRRQMGKGAGKGGVRPPSTERAGLRAGALFELR